MSVSTAGFCAVVQAACHLMSLPSPHPRLAAGPAPCVCRGLPLWLVWRMCPYSFSQELRDVGSLDSLRLEVGPSGNDMSCLGGKSEEAFGQKPGSQGEACIQGWAVTMKAGSSGPRLHRFATRGD